MHQTCITDLASLGKRKRLQTAIETFRENLIVVSDGEPEQPDVAIIKPPTTGRKSLLPPICCFRTFGQPSLLPLYNEPAALRSLPTFDQAENVFAPSDAPLSLSFGSRDSSWKDAPLPFVSGKLVSQLTDWLLETFESESRENFLLLSAPSSVAKCEIVYQVACSCGFQVNEVNATSCRDFDSLSRSLRESSQSKNIIGALLGSDTKSVILVEEIEAVYPADSRFWAFFATFESRVPVIFTSNLPAAYWSSKFTRNISIFDNARTSAIENISSTCYQFYSLFTSTGNFQAVCDEENFNRSPANESLYPPTTWLSRREPVECGALSNWRGNFLVEPPTCFRELGVPGVRRPLDSILGAGMDQFLLSYYQQAGATKMSLRPRRSLR